MRYGKGNEIITLEQDIIGAFRKHNLDVSKIKFQRMVWTVTATRNVK